MKRLHAFQFFLARIRYIIYRIALRVAFGSKFGGALGTGIFRDIEESSKNPELAKRILKKNLLASARVLTYDFPPDYPSWFCRSEAFSDRFQYQIADVVVSPFTSAMWIPNVAFLQQSNGSLLRIFNSHRGIIETYYPTTELNETAPICVAPNKSEYFHWLLEALPEVLHAKSNFPDCKVLTAMPLNRFKRQSMNFFNIQDDAIIYAETPIRAQKAILTPRWVNSGFIPQEDVDILRRHILSKLPATSPKRRIYISRSKSGNRSTYISRGKSENRSIVNESELEQLLMSFGFEICFFEEMDFTDQMRLCNEAEYLIAPHGAGLSNMIAGQPGMHVHELISITWPNTCYAKLAAQLEFNYSYTLLKPDDGGQITIDIQSMSRHIQSIWPNLVG